MCPLADNVLIDGYEIAGMRCSIYDTVAATSYITPYLYNGVQLFVAVTNKHSSSYNIPIGVEITYVKTIVK